MYVKTRLSNEPILFYCQQNPTIASSTVKIYSLPVIKSQCEQPFLNHISHISMCRVTVNSCIEH